MEDLTNWLLEKIVNHLVLREGCKKDILNVKRPETTAIVTDSLGFRYEVQVRCIGRLKNNVKDDNNLRYLA